MLGECRGDSSRPGDQAAADMSREVGAKGNE